MNSNINEKSEAPYSSISAERREGLFRKFTPKRVDGIVKNMSRNIEDYLSRYNREVEIEFEKRASFNGEYVWAARVRTKDGVIKEKFE